MDGTKKWFQTGGRSGKELKNPASEMGAPFAHKREKPANKIHADCARNLVDRARQFHRITAGALGNHRDGRYRDSLVGNTYPKFVTYRIDRLYQTISEAVNFFDGAFGGARNSFPGAVTQTKPQRYCANVKVFHFRHGDGLEDFCLRVLHEKFRVPGFKFQVHDTEFSVYRTRL